MSQDQWIQFALVFGTWALVIITGLGVRKTLRENREAQERDFKKRAEAQSEQFEYQRTIQERDLHLKILNDARRDISQTILGHVDWLTRLTAILKNVQDGTLDQADARIWDTFLDPLLGDFKQKSAINLLVFSYRTLLPDEMTSLSKLAQLSLDLQGQVGQVRTDLAAIWLDQPVDVQRTREAAERLREQIKNIQLNLLDADQSIQQACLKPIIGALRQRP